MAVARLSVTSAASNPDAADREPQRRGRALPAHVLDAAALQRRDAPARARVLAPRDGLVAAPAGGLARARPRRVPLRDPAAARGDRPRADHRDGPGRGASSRKAGVGPLEHWKVAEAPARRRRWYDGGDEVLAVLLASESDVDDLVPSLVAFQIEWNKIHQRAVATGWPLRDGATPEALSDALGGAVDDWARLRDIWGDAFEERLTAIVERTKSMRLRQLGGTQVGYQRMTRRWWSPAHAHARGQAPARRAAVLRLLQHPLALEPGDRPGARERGRARGLRRAAATTTTCRRSSCASAAAPPRGRGRTSCTSSRATTRRRTRRAARSARRPSSRPASSTCARTPRCASPRRSSRSPSSTRARLDPRLGAVDAERLSRSDAVIVNVDYPLGLAAYNLLHEVAVDSSGLRGAYILGKAATLNADVGDVMISSVIHDEHTSTTYWLDNAFTVDDIAPDLMFGTGPGQPARGDGQVDVPAEPRLPRLLLPRGVHGRRDGGRARTAPRSTRSPTPTATRSARP